MSVGEIVSLAVACLTALGLILTWGKNSRENIQSRAQMETSLKNEISDIKEDVRHPEHGLSAIKKKMDEQAIYCARTSTLLKEKVETLEKRV